MYTHTHTHTHPYTHVTSLFYMLNNGIIHVYLCTCTLLGDIFIQKYYIIISIIYKQIINGVFSQLYSSLRLEMGFINNFVYLKISIKNIIIS